MAAGVSSTGVTPFLQTSPTNTALYTWGVAVVSGRDRKCALLANVWRSQVWDLSKWRQFKEGGMDYVVWWG